MHLKGTPMRHPADPFLVFFLTEHVVDLLREGHVFNFSGDLVIELLGHLREVSVRVVDDGAGLLDHLNDSRLGGKLGLFLLSASLGPAIRSVCRRRRCVLRIGKSSFVFSVFALESTNHFRTILRAVVYASKDSSGYVFFDHDELLITGHRNVGFFRSLSLCSFKQKSKIEIDRVSPGAEKAPENFELLYLVKHCLALT